MNTFAALDFETANQYRSSVCSIGLVFVENNEIVDTYYQLIKPAPLSVPKYTDFRSTTPKRLLSSLKYGQKYYQK